MGVVAPGDVLDSCGTAEALVRVVAPPLGPEEIRRSVERRFGAEGVPERFRSFDTICSATQDRQDAVDELLRDALDVMVVIGGFNSSNTISLAAICAEKVPTYHVEDASNIDPEAGNIRFRPAGVQHSESVVGGFGRAAYLYGVLVIDILISVVLQS